MRNKEDGHEEKRFSCVGSLPEREFSVGANAGAASGRGASAAETGVAASQGDDQASFQSSAGLSQRGSDRARGTVGRGAEGAELWQRCQALAGSMLAARLERQAAQDGAHRVVQ